MSRHLSAEGTDQRGLSIEVVGINIGINQRQLKEDQRGSSGPDGLDVQALQSG